MHTSFSLDSNAEMQSLVEKSLQLGFTEIVFTDHVDYVAETQEFYFEIDYDEYMIEFNKIKNKYKDQINIILGVELGVALEVKNKLEKLTNKYPFEFIIASSHTIQGRDLYSGELFINKDKQQAFNEYFEEVLENVRNIDCFNVYGHFDYLTRYSKYKDNSLKYIDYKEIIDEILKELIVRGKGLEINTSGFRYNLGQLHPQLDILKAYKRLGGEILTVGSDAHNPASIGNYFKEAREAMLQCGFKSYTIFRNRNPIFVDIK